MAVIIAFAEPLWKRLSPPTHQTPKRFNVTFSQKSSQLSTPTTLNDNYCSRLSITPYRSTEHLRHSNFSLELWLEGSVVVGMTKNSGLILFSVVHINLIHRGYRAHV